MSSGKGVWRGVLRGGRRLAGLLVLAGFVALFWNLEWRCVAWLAPLAKTQLVPALLAANVAVAGAILLVTLLVGRMYCGVLCPLGLLQDLGNRVGRVIGWIFRRSAPNGGTALRRRVRVLVRHVVLAAVVIVGLCGLGFSWLEPYGIFGRMFVPWAGVVLGGLIVLLAVVGRGRVWCGWMCPVGTLLGWVAKAAPFRLKIGGACIGCRKCERVCRTDAVILAGKGGVIDPSLCVDCLDCLAECPVGAIAFGRGGTSAAQTADAAEAGGLTRKGFIAGTAVTGMALAAQTAEDKVFDGGLADIVPPGIDVRNAPLKPAGSRSLANFTTRCVGCQLCVKACPNQVLRPSLRVKDFMQPEMAFDKGYCTVDCTRCAEVCPAGAIAPLGDLHKEHVHIGLAVWHKDRCLAATEGVVCTACERHCPVKAIKLVKVEGGGRVPVVDDVKCIGCGACEHVCPSRPLPGMTVKAYEIHREVRPKSIAEVRTEAAEVQAECGPDAVSWLRPADS